jgi:hypothetical protein
MARQIVAAGRFVERAQQRLRKRIADDRHALHAVRSTAAQIACGSK